jgi:hypothetical protein
MQIKLAPNVQAVHVILWPPSLASTTQPTNTAERAHNPAPSIIIHLCPHSGRDSVTAVTFEMCRKPAATAVFLRGMRALNVDGTASRKSHKISNSIIVAFTQLI